MARSMPSALRPSVARMNGIGPSPVSSAPSSARSARPNMRMVGMSAVLPGGPDLAVARRAWLLPLARLGVLVPVALAAVLGGAFLVAHAVATVQAQPG